MIPSSRSKAHLKMANSGRHLFHSLLYHHHVSFHCRCGPGSHSGNGSAVAAGEVAAIERLASIAREDSVCKTHTGPSHLGLRGSTTSDWLRLVNLGMGETEQQCRLVCSPQDRAGPCELFCTISEHCSAKCGVLTYRIPMYGLQQLSSGSYLGSTRVHGKPSLFRSTSHGTDDHLRCVPRRHYSLCFQPHGLFCLGDHNDIQHNPPSQASVAGVGVNPYPGPLYRHTSALDPWHLLDMYLTAFAAPQGCRSKENQVYHTYSASTMVPTLQDLAFWFDETTTTTLARAFHKVYKACLLVHDLWE